MNIDNLKSIEQISAFLAGSQAIVFAVASNKDERYLFVEKVLKRFNYCRLKRKEKSVLLKFLLKVTGYSRQQLTRMVERYVDTGKLKRFQKTTNGFAPRYTDADVLLLAKLDERHDTPNGAMVKNLCYRAYHQFNETDYKRLSTISVSHIYNLRKKFRYRTARVHFEKTKATHGLLIGERRKPTPNGQPGYIRIDTVHQGDSDGKKGVYHINAVDEVTQFEIVATVEKISEDYLIPALEILLDSFPFVIINFHSDNGSEYVNKTVVNLLKKLLIEFTKSRPRHSNDNGLAESKNAAVVRKTFGYVHIPQQYSKIINEFNRTALNPYVNYHRPCYFPTIIIDEKGKEKKKYNYKDVMTPYEKLKSLPNAKKYLKAGITFEILDDIAYKITDNEAADFLQEKHKLLFKNIHEDCKARA
jgi:transposase InsO family protein